MSSACATASTAITTRSSCAGRCCRRMAENRSRSASISWCWAKMAASAPATSSLKCDGVLLELVERDDLQGDGVGRLEHDLRRRAGIERLLPARGAEAPAVAGLQPGEAVLREGCAEVVAGLLRERQELRRHDAANRVQAKVLLAGVAAAVAIEPGDRVDRAGSERPAQDVDRGCPARAAAFFRRLIEHGGTLPPGICAFDQAAPLVESPRHHEVAAGRVHNGA